jgi:hypothetical protein
VNSVIDMSKASERREVATTESTSLLQVIERAARDPSVDIERMERLLAMHERLVAGQARAAYAGALARLQPKLPIIQERGEILNKTGGVQSRYALWEDIVGVITPILASEGFALSFRIGNQEQRIQVTGVLTHAAGHSEQTPLDLPADVSGNKNAVQAIASSVSYGKRYTAGALLNLRMGAIDDDGQSATMGPKLSAEQVEQVERRLKEANVDRAGFLDFWQVEQVWNIPACNFALIMQRLDKAAKKVDPRGDLSNVAEPMRDKHVSAVADILNSDKEEADIAESLRGYVAEALNPFPDLYTTVLDKLAADGIISKANFRKYLQVPRRPE